MNKSMLIFALFGALGLSACDKKPDVINVTPAPAVVPGPAGPQGPTGESGKAGDSSTVIVMPPASAPASAPAN